MKFRKAVLISKIEKSCLLRILRIVHVEKLFSSGDSEGTTSIQNYRKSRSFSAAIFCQIVMTVMVSKKLHFDRYETPFAPTCST